MFPHGLLATVGVDEAFGDGVASLPTVALLLTVFLQSVELIIELRLTEILDSVALGQQTNTHTQRNQCKETNTHTHTHKENVTDKQTNKSNVNKQENQSM